MLIKWVNCSVVPEKKTQFNESQQQWSALEKIDGFLGQSGGWEIGSDNQAYVISLWEDWEAYKTFMLKSHDKLYRENAQANTYESMAISLFEILMEFPGKAHSIQEGLSNSAIIRITDCTLNRNRDDHFMKMQKEIWAPKIQETPGLIDGLFARQRGMQDRYLTLSLWENQEAYKHYIDNVYPQIMDSKELERDIETISEKLVSLEESWFVAGAVHEILT